MITVETYREELQARGIDDSQYSDAEIQGWISQAELLVGDEVSRATSHEEYIRLFDNDVYLTNCYPIDVESVELLLNDEEVTPLKILSDGIIYFEHDKRGTLSCKYNTSIDEELVNNVILQASMYIMQDQTGGNYSSIDEGDVSVSYDTSSPLSEQNRLDGIISQLQGKYKARVRLL